MRIAGHLPPQDWMTAPETQAVLEALQADGTEVRFVGGCVRDALLRRPVSDVDIATPDAPETVIELLARAGLRAVPTGLKHGTVTAVAGGRGFEVTTLRVDVETYGRHAKVAFTDDWTADAARRDFTLNALYLAPDGTLYDAFGGLEDLKARRIRFVGRAADRIREDVLRLLRFFRFYAHFGTPPPDPDALDACAEFAHLVPRLSAERVWAELRKLLSAPAPAPVLALMRDHGVLVHVLPEAVDIDRLDALTAIQDDLSGLDGTPSTDDPDPVLRLAATLHGDAAGARALAERLRFSNAERDRLERIETALPGFAPEDRPRARRRRLYELGAGLYRDLVLLHWATRRAIAPVPPEEVERYEDNLAAAAAWRRPALPVKGRDALSLGVEKGPRVGELIAAVERWWADEDFQPGREACLAKLEALAREG